MLKTSKLTTSLEIKSNNLGIRVINYQQIRLFLVFLLFVAPSYTDWIRCLDIKIAYPGEYPGVSGTDKSNFRKNKFIRSMPRKEIALKPV